MKNKKITIKTLTSTIKNHEIATLCKKITKIGRIIGSTTFLVGTLIKSKKITTLGISAYAAFLLGNIASNSAQKRCQRKIEEFEDMPLLVIEDEAKSQKNTTSDEYYFEVGM